MSFAEELQKLAALHEAGQLNDAEFAVAKRRLLEPGGAEASPEAERTNRQQAVNALDIEWIQTRQRLGYVYGPRPTRSMIYVMWGVFALLIVVTTMASWNKGEVGIALAGALVIAVIGAVIHGRLMDFVRAEQAYRIRREELAGPDQSWSTIKDLRER